MRAARVSRILLALTILAGLPACHGGPGERDEGSTDGAPPLPAAGELERLGQAAGASLNAALLHVPDPISTDRFDASALPEELRAIDEASVMAGFLTGARVRTAPGASGLARLSVRVTALVRRARGGVAVDHGFAFTLVAPSGETLWTAFLSVTARGSRRTLVPRALSGKDLDDLASLAARDVQRSLFDRRKRAAVLTPVRSPGDEVPGVALGFEDRLRAALFEKHVAFGTGPALPRIEPEAAFEGLNRATGAETHAFRVELFESDAAFPWSRWERSVTKATDASGD